MLALIFTVITSSLYLLWWSLRNRLPKDYPPTPLISLPILGHAHYLLRHGLSGAISSLEDLYDNYSKHGIVVVHIGSAEKYLIVGSPSVARELLGKEETASQRFTNAAADRFIKDMRDNFTGREGVLFNSGTKWVEQRRFMLSTLRDFGFGKSSMEELIAEEVVEFMDHLEMKSASGPIEVKELFNIVILNVLWRIIASERFGYDDPQLKELVALVNDLLSVAGPRPSTSIPALRRFVIGDMRDKTLKIKKHLEATIEQHSKTLDPSTARDYIDAFLIKIKETESPSSSFCPSEGWEQLACALLDIFFAGSETTSTSLTFAIFFMTKHQHVQKRVREEIHSLLGRDTLPGLRDRKKLPYTEATIMETFRMANVVPLGLPHATTAPIRVGPYTIPANHTMYINMKSIMQSEKYWPNPSDFNPERFLDSTGKSLAEAEMFLFLVSMLQRFSFEPEDPNCPLEMELERGLTQAPKPFKVALSRC